MTQTRQEYNLYNTKNQITAEDKIVSDYGQDPNWTKSPEDKRWRPIPAQAKPEEIGRASCRERVLRLV